MGKILTWQQQTDASTPLLWTEGYDTAGQLTSAVRTSTAMTSPALVSDSYGYDAAGNMTSSSLSGVARSPSYNSLNQLTSSTPSGSPTVRFTGTLNETATVTVNGSAATLSGTNFSGGAVLSPGSTNTVAVVAQDSHGNTRTNNYQTIVAPQPSYSPTYDADGNELTNGAGQTYTWDAKSELISITYTGGASTLFTYDALGRRIGIVEKNSGGTVTSTKQFVWDGTRLAEERNAGNTVTKRFYAQGEQISGASYFYTRDHLGSIREMTDSSGNIQARYDYDPYGRVTKISGSTDSDFQYAGYYEHATSGLNLTMFRAYDPNTAKWLSRDPAGEIERRDGHGGTIGGLNLYGYVDNNPVDWVDFLGLGHGSGLGPNGQPPANNNGSAAQQTAAMVNYLTKADTLLPPTPLDNTDFGEFSLFNLINGNGIKWSAEAAVLTPCKKKLLDSIAPEAEAPAAELGLLAVAYATIADATYYFNQAISPPPSQPYGDAGLDSGPD
jgi:RHS repeat-associated protein